jgi:hypothetical protein
VVESLLREEVLLKRVDRRLSEPVAREPQEGEDASEVVNPLHLVTCRSGYEFLSTAVSEGESRRVVFLSLRRGEKWC